MIRAKDIMTEDLVVIKGKTLVRQIAHMMLRNRITALPVVENKKLIGIVSTADLFMILYKAYVKKIDAEFHKRLAMFRDMTAEDIMTRKVITIKPTTSLDEIVDLVSKKRVHVFPVVEGKKLIGIVSRHDILNAVFSYD